MALVASCTTLVRDGMVVDTRSEIVTKAQEGVIEFLLINHPLDCSICDKGGECPRQDQAFSYGPGESRYVEEKRRFVKPIPISDLILLDRERCILCGLCTRFSDDISGDPLIEFKGRGNRVEVITFPDEPYASYFSGNTVQLCPVGALTAKPYRCNARPCALSAVAPVSFVDSVHPTTSFPPRACQVVRSLRLALAGGTRVLWTQATAHTDNELTITDRATDTLFLGDLLFSVHVPTLDGSIKGWLALLEQLASKQAARVIPGHGPQAMELPQALEPEQRLALREREAVRMFAQGLEHHQKGELEEAVKVYGQALLLNPKLS